MNIGRLICILLCTFCVVASISQLQLKVFGQHLEIFVDKLARHLTQGRWVPLRQIVLVNQECSDPLVKVGIHATPDHHFELHLQTLFQAFQLLSFAHLAVSNFHRCGREFGHRVNSPGGQFALLAMGLEMAKDLFHTAGLTCFVD